MKYLILTLTLVSAASLAVGQYLFDVEYTNSACTNILRYSANWTTICDTEHPFRYECVGNQIIQYDCSCGSGCSALETVPNPTACVQTSSSRWKRMYCGYPPLGFNGRIELTYLPSSNKTGCSGLPDKIQFWLNGYCERSLVGGNSTMLSCNPDTNTTFAQYYYSNIDCSGTRDSTRTLPAPPAGCVNNTTVYACGSSAVVPNPPSNQATLGPNINVIPPSTTLTPNQLSSTVPRASEGSRIDTSRLQCFVVVLTIIAGSVLLGL